MRSFPCPCCGHLTFDEPPGSHSICPVCFWEDDYVQLRWPQWRGGANRPSLIEAQQAYADCGACEPAMLANVRPAAANEPVEAGWRPLDRELDDFEQLDEVITQAPRDTTVLYWWRPTYWRAGHR